MQIHYQTLALALAGTLGCAHGSIRGVVRDANTDEAIANARVTLDCNCLDAAPTVLTDERGAYSFDKLPRGDYAVRVSAGQADVSEVFELPWHADFRANFSLDTESAAPVVIVADPPRPIGYDCIDCDFPLGHSPPIYLRTTVGNSLRDAVEAKTY